MTPWVISGVLAVMVLVLGFKIVSMHSSMKEMTAIFQDCLNDDTNMLVTVSSSDRHIRMLVKEINRNLRLLRQQRIQYENGDKELKEAITNISHDLRTPLTAILGYLELMEGEKKETDVEKYLGYVRERTEKMIDLTEELFRYTVILSTQEVSLEAVSLNEVLENSLLSFYGALTENGIEPTIDVPEEKVMVLGNEKALERVFGNIINNALKYSDGDLKVTLSREGRISFSNRASALNEVFVGRLFQRFYTVESAHQSTGLGLAIAKELVLQMGGEISASYLDGSVSISIELNKG